MELLLCHGRDTSDELMDDLGFDGPTLQGVHSVQQRYRITTTVKFVSKEAADAARDLTSWPIWDDGILEVPWNGDLIETYEPDGCRRYYADVVLSHHSAEEEIEKIAECISDARCSLNRASGYLRKRSKDL